MASGEDRTALGRRPVDSADLTITGIGSALSQLRPIAAAGLGLPPKPRPALAGEEAQWKPRSSVP